MLRKMARSRLEVPIQILVQEAKGLSSARQLALEHSKGEWIAITDIDVEPGQNWISNLFAESKPVSPERKCCCSNGKNNFRES